MRIAVVLALSLAVLSCSADDSAPVSLAYAEDPGICTNAPDIEFQSQIWYSFKAIFESWAEAGRMSGTFTVEGDVGTFVGDDGGVIVSQRLDASGFREMQCSLGYTPG
jgi:hypothetical protein